MIQLELFEQKRDLEKEMEDLKSQMEKVRKSLYAREAEIRKLHVDTAHRLQILELNICKGRLL